MSAQFEHNYVQIIFDRIKDIKMIINKIIIKLNSSISIMKIIWCLQDSNKTILKFNSIKSNIHIKQSLQIQLECSSSITSLMIIQIFIIYKTIYTFSNVINMKFCIIQAASYQLYLYIPYPYFMTSLEFISTVINDTHF